MNPQYRVKLTNNKNTLRKNILFLLIIILTICCKNEKPKNLINRVGGDASLAEISYEFRDSTAISKYDIGFNYLRKENLEMAKKYFLESLKIEPQNITILNVIGSIEANFKNFEKSYEYFEKSLRIKPRYSNTYMSYGVALNKSTEQLIAIEIWRKGLELELNYEKTGYFNYNIANAYYKLDEFKKSKKYNDIALGIVSDKEVIKDLMELKNALEKLTE